MNPLPYFDTVLGRVAAILLLLWGIAVVWTSLTGGSDPTQALARRRVRMLQRMEAFRRLMAGLVLIGLGAAVLMQAPWMLWLALGIGFVEILESSTLIAVWKLRPPNRTRT
ncbi:MAG: hypothetical protein U0075_05175 [Thermomicrobiales bacterium]